MREEVFWTELNTLLRQTLLLDQLGAYDWIEPKKYILGKNSTIHGIIGLVGGPALTRKFELRLRRNLNSLSEIDWENCLPDSEKKGWFWEESGKVILESPPVRSKA